MPRAMPVRAASAPRPAPSAVIPPAAPLPHATVQSAVLPTTGALAPAGARATPPGQASGDMAAGLRELLLGAGLTELSPEAMRELGQVLRIVVQGVMQVLQARSEIKAQFRLPLTRVQARENNPLKFSPDVESVLNTLLVRRNAAYLATVPAFEEAFADIRNHQMALLEGIRVAFDSMVKRFDPAELQKQFDSSAKGNAGLFSRNGLGAKSRYWDLYREFFERLGTDADDTFRRLFGDVFAQAYEQQLNRMKRPAGGRNVEGQGE
jgi:type VI secretion system FHA domain protein